MADSTSSSNYGKKKFPLLAVAAGGAAVVAAIVFWPKSSNAAPGQNPIPGGGGPVPGGGGGRKKDPDPSLFPPGAGIGRGRPNAQNGNLIRTGPGTNNPLAAPEGDLHIRPGDTFVLIKKGIAPTDGQGGSWWQVISSSGTRGFTRGVDPKTGQDNFDTVREPTTPPGPVASANPFAGAKTTGEAQVAGVAGLAPPATIGGRAFGVAYDFMGQQAAARTPRSPAAGAHPILARRFARFTGRPVAVFAALPAGPTLTCQAPAGCWLRSVPDGRAPGQLLVEPNARVVVDEFVPGVKQEATSPGHGGWARVRYYGRGMGQPVTGYVLSEWLS